MWNDIFNVALSNGIFASLFVGLLIYELKDSRKREAKYQNTIENLSTILSTVDEIKEDVIEIKQCLTQPPRRKNEKSNKVV